MVIQRHVRSESMIHFCDCAKHSQSPLVYPKSRYNSKFCKSCGGRLPVDGPSAQSVSMLSTVGLELPRVIDPHLTWKTSTNGRQRVRAVRRARTLFTGANGKKSPVRSSKESEGLLDNDRKSKVDMPVSESEKLGVSILGRRFSENLGSVPIKKRRFLLVHSPSSPLRSSDIVVGNQASSYQEAVVTQNFNLHDIKSDNRGSSSSEGKTAMEEVNEKISDAADFSGISILAAAACDDKIGGDSVTAEASVCKEQSSGEQDIALNSSKLHFLTETNEELLPCASEGLVGRTNLPSVLSASSVLPSKQANDVKSDGSSAGISVNSLQKLPSRETEYTSRDIRFHWDLNIVMDVWESNDDEVLNSEPRSTNVCVEAGHNENYGNVETYQNQVGCEDAKNDSEPCDNEVHLVGEGKGICESVNIKMEESPGISSTYPTAGDNGGKPCFPVLYVDTSGKDERQSEVPINNMANVSAETSSLCNASKSCTVSVDFPLSVGDATVSLGDILLFSSAAVEEEKAGQNCESFISDVETRNSSSYLVLCENSVESPADPFEPHHGEDQGIVEALSVEKISVASVLGQENRADTCRLTYVQMAQGTHIRSHQGEEEEALCTNPVAVRTDVTDLQSFGTHLAEKMSDALIDGNICSSMVIAGENVHVGSQKQTKFDADKTKGIDDFSCDGECGITAAEMEFDTIAAEIKVDMATTDSEVDTIAGEIMADTITAETKVDPKDVEMNGDKCQLVTAGSRNATKIDLPDCIESVTLKSDYYSDASQNDADHTVRTEKVDFPGDDDSQYEDGEVRQSSLGCWLEDRAEEEEIEHVDYGSDRETEIYEAASDLPNCVNPQVSNECFPNTSLGIPHRGHVAKDSQHFVSPSILNCPLIEDALNSEAGRTNAGSFTERGLSGRARTEDGTKQLTCEIENASNFSTNDKKVTENGGFLNGVDGAREPRLTSSKVKMSGWDHLPVVCRSSIQYHNGNSLDTKVANESAGRAVGSSIRDLSSRMERVKSSCGSDRKDKSYIRPSRSNGRNNFNLQVEGDASTIRSIGRSRSSIKSQVRGRGDRSPEPHGNSRHDSSDYYSFVGTSQPASRNATAAAVAKVESNGFVVAPDGTIVKASAVGSSGLLARGSANTSPRSTHRSPMGRESVIDRSYGMPPGYVRRREMSSVMAMQVGGDRAGRYGSGIVSMGRERYYAPISDDVVGSSSSINPLISRSDYSFSHRRRFNLSRSRSRSPSRSRTRSPPRWASPRGRNDYRINGSAGRLWRESKSQNLNSEAVMDRPRPVFQKRVISYVPSSRTRTSPPHSWINGRKDLLENLRVHKYRQLSGSSPPPRVFSGAQRYDQLDSSGRLKAGEFYQSMDSEKFTDSVGFDRGSREDDRRGQCDRSKMPDSVRRYNNDCNMRHFQYDSEDGFRSHNPPPKSPEFQQGESPRAFDRNIKRQFGDSPWSFKEKIRQFRKDR